MSEEMQLKMENVLTGVATIYPSIGYCQGMSFIAGEILNIVTEEELAFWLFVGLIEKHHLNVLFMNVLFIF